MIVLAEGVAFLGKANQSCKLTVGRAQGITSISRFAIEPLSHDVYVKIWTIRRKNSERIFVVSVGVY